MKAKSSLSLSHCDPTELGYTHKISSAGLPDESSPLYSERQRDVSVCIIVKHSVHLNN